jgi:hypothetical protein
MNHYDQQLAMENDGPNRYGWFTELKNGWIFHGELLNNQMVYVMFAVPPLGLKQRRSMRIETHQQYTWVYQKKHSAGKWNTKPTS